jgi:uncharacterized protein involved in exopolysaccharide biosynthesis
VSDSHERQEQTHQTDEESTVAPRTAPQEALRGTAEEDTGRDDTVSLLDLIAVIARRWRLIFFTTFFAAIGIVLFSIYTLRIPPDSPYNPLPNVYTPEAQVLLTDPDSGSNLAANLNNGELGILAGFANLGGGQGENSAALAQELLQGNALIDQIVEEFNLLEEYTDSEFPKTTARNAIRESLTAEFDNTSGILEVTFDHIDPVFATDVLQRIITLLESRFTSLTRDDARSRTQAIELQLQQLEDDLEQARDNLTSFQERYGVIDPENQGQQTIDLIAQFRQRKFDLELEREQIFELVQDREDPQIKRINQNIRRIEQLITELETGYRLYSPVTIPLDEIGQLTVRYADLQRDLLLKEQVYSTFQAELIRARIESQDTTRRFQIVEPPEVPEVKSGPSRGMISIIVTITAFFLSIFLAFVLEYFSRAKEDPEESKKLELIKAQFRMRKQR